MVGKFNFDGAFKIMLRIIAPLRRHSRLNPEPFFLTIVLLERDAGPGPAQYNSTIPDI